MEEPPISCPMRASPAGTLNLGPAVRSLRRAFLLHGGQARLRFRIAALIVIRNAIGAPVLVNLDHWRAAPPTTRPPIETVMPSALAVTAMTNDRANQPHISPDRLWPRAKVATLITSMYARDEQ